MNILLFNSSELTQDHKIVINDDRLSRLGELRGGQRLRVGELYGGIGYGTVECATDSEACIAVDELLEPASKIDTDLIVALPRPQMVKRILELCGVLGIRRLFLIRTAQVEKSYFQSSVLQREELWRHLLLGMEQGVSVVPTEVRVCRYFREFAEQHLKDLSGAEDLAVIADPRATMEIADVAESDSRIRRCVLAVGPESGFTEYEVKIFQQYGFLSCHLGSQIMRVDTAACYLTAQAQMIASIARKRDKQELTARKMVLL